MDRESRAGSVVDTRSGRLRGTREAGLHVFRGVPYAMPPAGSLRLRPPRPASPWPGVRDAERPGPSAPQNPTALSKLLGTTAEQCDEDCLTLNLWTPGLDGARRPVMVWLHGGAFTTGAGSQRFYDGAGLARRGDVVIVTLNYRLGALGWLALPELADEDGEAWGNFGLLDQMAALAWVREHAAGFGGDPDNVTVFGESAGAMSVGTLLGVPDARGLFRRAILQSGAAHNVSSRDQAERVAHAFLEELDLAPRSAARLRELPRAVLLAAQARLFRRRVGGAGSLYFQPVCDGQLVPRPPLEAIAEGSAAEIAILAGTNLDEYKLWSPTDPRARSLDEERLLRRLRRVIPGEAPDGRAHADRALAAYRTARPGRASVEPAELWFAIESDRLFHMPATRLLELQSPWATDVRSYLVSWRSPALDGALGSCHALEVPFVFGRVGDPQMVPFVGGDGAESLSERIQDAWLAFARAGDPGHPDLPDWPRYGPEQRATLVLDRQCAVVDDPWKEQRRFWESLL